MSRIAPQTEAEAAEAIRSQDGPLTIVGNGSRLALGADTGAPEISAGAMRGVVDYQPAALSLVVRAGTTMDEIAATLAAERQRLPFEPTDHRVLLGDGAPTIGGTVAGNHSGPRRIRDGACRDALLGVRMVNGRGEIVKSGGKVMKNVTGLDLVKLAAGSWGGLGLMTEFCFRTQPLPEMTATLRAEGTLLGTARDDMRTA